VLFTSGYTQNAIIHGGRLDPGVELLSKPYSREQLAHKIRQMLDAGSAVPAGRPSAASQPDSASAFRILLVDDDANLAEAMHELLGQLGHAPKITTSAREALEWLAKESFDVLITDLKMPGIDGIELSSQAAAHHPSLRVVFSSGYDMPLVPALPFRWAALRKPYTIEELNAVLRGFAD
jgi:CheY-like chemotaxis protein